MGVRSVSTPTKQPCLPNLPKTKRGEVAGQDRAELPPTQIGRALQELGIEWIAAHSPQAKGRVERGFGTMQDRLVKGLRVAGAKTLEQANAYLREEFLPWWNQTLTSQPASSDDAHRALGKEHSLAASLSYVDSRQVARDYTIRFDNRVYQIQRADVRAGLRGSTVRVEARLDGSLAVRFRDHYLALAECPVRPKATPPRAKPRPRKKALRKSAWMKNFHLSKRRKSANPSIR